MLLNHKLEIHPLIFSKVCYKAKRRMMSEDRSEKRKQSALSKN